MPHVAFVPLVGARVHEERVLALGMSLPGFRQRGRAIGGLPALGLLTLAGMTPGAWGRSWHELQGDPRTVVDELVLQRPTFVAISALTASVDEAYALCALLRDEGLPVVVGGLHATALPDEVLQHADAVCVGEGEPVWPLILRDAQNGRLRGRYQAERAFDLSDAPLPAFELLGDGVRPRYTLQTARGCPFACEFCAASRLLGPFRQKPLPRIEAELDAIARREARPLIELADDNTFAGRDAPWLPAFAQVHARWFTESDWRIGERPELLEQLRASGCRQVLVGIESLVFRHPGMGAKADRLERMLAAVDAIQAAGIVVNGCFVLGADGETDESAERLAEFLCDSPFAEVQVTLQTPFPGAPLRERLRAEGRLPADAPWSSHTLFDVCFEPDRMSVVELEAAFEAVLRRVFSAQQTEKRARLRRSVWRRAREVRA